MRHHHWLRATDVAVITGGARGLGHSIVRELSVATRVVVLDLEQPSHNQRVGGVVYLICDITDYYALHKCLYFIEKHLGTVTVLVNNAGIRGPLKSVVESPHIDIDMTINTNLTGTIQVVKTILPGMIRKQRGFIVTVSSVLGYIAPAGLSAYGASKAGLVSFNESLQYELGSASGVQTLLVCCGQLQTRMFRDVNTPSVLLAPVLSPDKLGRSIVARIQNGDSGVVFAPLYARVMPFMRGALPPHAVKLLRHWSGVDAVWSTPRLRRAQ